MIKFNFSTAPVASALTGTQTQVKSINEIAQIPQTLEGVPKERLPWIQMFDNGQRASLKAADTASSEWQNWNGSVFVDFDSKKYKSDWNKRIQINAETLKTNFQTIFNCISQFLQNDETYNSTFLFSQISHSGTSAHFVFFFDVEKTFSNFSKASQFAREAVHAAITPLLSFGEELFNFPDVVDKCANRPAQPLYISRFPITINPECNGACNLDAAIKDIQEVINYSPREIEFQSKVEDVHFTGLFDYSLDWSHFGRHALCKVFANYFGKENEQRALELYDEILPLVATQVKDHTQGWLKSAFASTYKQTLLYISQGKVEYTKMKSNWLKFCEQAFNIKFVYKNEFKPLRLTHEDYDEMHTLRANETLAVILQRIIDNDRQVTHIEAGCGLGKTYSAVSYVRQTKQNAQRDSFSLFDLSVSATTGKRICFVTPMTSINRNTFDKFPSDWVVIDSLHKDKTKLTDRAFSVCTTWNSFCLFEMYEMQFDVFIFDEAHSLFLYDYRVNDICLMFDAMQKLYSAGKKMIFLSGTPTKDRDLFCAYKVKVEKDVWKIPTTINFYNKDFHGQLYKDIREWKGQSKDNVAVVFCDTANAEMEEAFAKRGLKVDAVYNKNYTEDVKVINDSEQLSGQVVLVSAYGQAGVNIYARPNECVKIFVLSSNAIAVIQYLNRIRNKEHIDSVQLYVCRADINNTLTTFDVVDIDGAKKRVEYINEVQKADDYYLKRYLGLAKSVLDVVDGKTVLNENKFKVLQTINNVCQTEKQIQMLYNRLIDANCTVSLKYWDTDEKDVYDKKIRSNFIGLLTAIGRAKYAKAITTKDEWLNLDREVFTQSERKFITDEVKRSLETIINYYHGQYISEKESDYNWGDAKKFVCEKFSALVDRLMSNSTKETATKSDIMAFAEVLEIKEQFARKADSLLLVKLSQAVAEDSASNEWLCRYAAGDVACRATNEVPENMLIKMADENYRSLVHFRNILKKYNWMVESEKEDAAKYDVQVPECNQALFAMLYNVLMKKHSQGKGGRRNCKTVKAYSKEGCFMGEWETIEAAANAYGVSIKTIQRCAQKRSLIKKLNVFFVYE
jgi:hypothetical protein